ncbi:MAG: hypothetical protein JWP12_2549 [Bacteroidetes bacterium]|nr:hypothetical protein [Bacteroidota bacterium]
MKKKLLLFTAFASLLNTAIGQVPGFAWAKQTSSVTTDAGVDVVGAIATDTVNHFLYITGDATSGSIDFGTGELTGSSGANNIYFAKYNLNGGIIWAKSYYSGYNAFASGLVVDNSGNVFMTGYSQNDTVRFGTHFLYNSSPNSTDHTVAFLAKFDANGNCLWLKGNTGGGGMQISSVVLDNTGNPYITGFSIDDASMFGTYSVIGGFFAAKFDPNGNLVWFTQGGPDEPMVSQGRSIAIDHSGNCVVAGSYAADIYFGSFPIPNTNGNGTDDRFVVKMNGATGAFIWAESEGIWESSDVNFGVATDASDNIYLTGYTGIAISGTGSSDFASENFIEKLNSSGVSQWINGYSNPYYTSTPSITADAAGNTFVAFQLGDTVAFGAFTISPNLPFGPGSSTVTVVVKTNSAGTVMYAKASTIPTSGSFGITLETPMGIALDGSENVYFTGRLYGATDCDATHLDAGTGSQVMLAKLGSTVSGINEIGAQNPVYAVYPNPANDLIYIDKLTGKTTMQIVDLSGKEVIAAQLSNTTESIDVSSLQNGIYFIELTTTTSHVTQKLIIAK